MRTIFYIQIFRHNIPLYIHVYIFDEISLQFQLYFTFYFAFFFPFCKKNAISTHTVPIFLLLTLKFNLFRKLIENKKELQ